MSSTTTQTQNGTYNPPRFIVSVAWLITLLASSLMDALLFKLIGTPPSWLFWAKIIFLGALITATLLWKPIQVLRPFFIMLLAIIALMKANSSLLALPAWLSWQRQQSFTVVAIVAQLLEMGVALILIGILFLLRKRRQRFFLVIGDMQATAEPSKLFGQKKPGSLAQFGFIFTVVVIAVQFFMLIFPLSLSFNAVRSMVPLIPLILLLAVSNGFNEEIIFRSGPISPIYEVVGRSNAIWMAAVLFGSAHYFGGIPSGITGVLTTTFLGWFFGKCMLDSRGFFWPWLFHTLQDILPFTLMALATLTSNS